MQGLQFVSDLIHGKIHKTVLIYKKIYSLFRLALMTKIQMTDPLNIDVPKVIVEAPIYREPHYNIPKHCLFHNHDIVKSNVSHIIERSYELPEKWYFITFKPFNKNYEKNIELYTTKCLDHCRKKLGKVSAYIMTREIKATKIHVNILCVTDRPLVKLLHGKKTYRYYIYCQEASSKRDSLEYIIKESKERYFYKYVDYVSSQ
jgi:hypothetical protein